MSIAEDINNNSENTFSSTWAVRDGLVVPASTDLRLSNDAVQFQNSTILYADLDGSTNLVEKKKWTFAGQAYKTFLYAASRIIRSHGGSIVS